jgi:hypothetical protein
LPPVERVSSNGIRANGCKVFSIDFTGRKVYELLKQLEDTAVQSDHYLEVMRCVLTAEYIREQAKAQGY